MASQYQGVIKAYSVGDNATHLSCCWFNSANCLALLFNVPLSTTMSESRLDDIIRIFDESPGYWKDELTNGDMGNAPLSVILQFSFSSIVLSSTAVVPSVRCTKMGGAGADNLLRGPSCPNDIFESLREPVAFLAGEMLLQGFINDWMNKSASPGDVPSTWRLSREVEGLRWLPNGGSFLSMARNGEDVSGTDELR